jgi:hypothetical protein
MRQAWNDLGLRDGLALVAVALLVVGMSGCGEAPSPSRATTSTAADPFVPPPPDVGDVTRYQACKARPRRALSQREHCQIATFAAQCNQANDCLVTCLSSPDGDTVGGGCWHVCFSALHRDEPLPPGFDECQRLPATGRLDMPAAARSS